MSNQNKTISPNDVLKNKYSFIKTSDGRLTLVDKNYNILLWDVQNQPHLIDWIDQNNLWNKPNGMVEVGLFNHIRNSNGLHTIRKSFQWGNNIAGGFLAGTVLAPTLLELSPTNLLNNGIKPFIKSINQLYNPYTYHGAALTSVTSANEINNFKNNPNIENGILSTLSLLPIIPKGLPQNKIISTIWNNKLNIKPSINPLYYQKSLKIGNNYFPKQKDYFQYNAFLDSHFYPKHIQESIKQFAKDKDVTKLQNYLKQLPNEEKDYLRSFLRSYYFQDEKVPYYTSLKDLLSEHSSLRKTFNQSDKTQQKYITSLKNFVLDNGDDFGILVQQPDQITHEYEHALQLKKIIPYFPEQEKLLHKAYPHSFGSGITSKVEEKGAVNNQLRTILIDSYKDEFGKLPTVKQLQKYIDDFPNEDLLNLLETRTNLYGEEYVDNKANAKKVKEALKYVGTITIPAYFSNNK